VSRSRRKPLGELTNTNWVRNQSTGALIKKHVVDAPRTTYGCSECNINLCKEGRCYEEHLEAIRLKALQHVQASLQAEQPTSEVDDDLLDSFEYSSEAGNDLLGEFEAITSSNTGGEASSFGESFTTQSLNGPYYNCNFST
jgi:hypothetical protein